MVALRYTGVRTGTHRRVQVVVIGISGTLVWLVVRAFFMFVGVADVSVFQYEVPVIIGAQHHSPIQAEAAHRQDGGANNETGNGAVRHAS